MMTDAGGALAQGQPKPDPSSAKTPLEGLCQPSTGPEPTGPIEVPIELDASEFEIMGYDVRRQLLTLRPHAELAMTQSRPVRLRLHTQGDLLLPLPPPLVHETVGAFVGQRVVLTLWVEPLPRAPESPTASCESAGLDVRPLRIALRIGVLPLAEARCPTHPQSSDLGLGHVEVGPVSSDDGDAATAHSMGEATLPAGQDCLRRALATVSSVQGSLMVELERGAIGDRRRPRIVVDGVVSRALGDCLVNALFHDERVWKAMPYGRRVYVPFYFRGAPLPTSGLEPYGSPDVPHVPVSTDPKASNPP